MPIQTYNPIGTRSDHVPAPETGTVAVAYHNDEAWLVRERQENWATRLSEMAKPRTMLPAGILLVSLSYLLGAIGSIIGLLIGGAAIVAVVMNRRNPIALVLLGPTPGYYLVNVAENRVLDEVRVQAGPGVFLRVDLEYRAAVVDPAGIVKKGIKDVREYLSGELHSLVHGLTGHASLEDRGLAFLSALRGLEWSADGDKLFKIGMLSCQVHFEGATGAAISALAQKTLEIEAIKAASEKATAERQYYETLVHDPSLLQAEMLRPGTDKEILRQAAQTLLDDERTRADAKIKMIELGFKTGVLQEHTIKGKHPELYQAFEEAARGIFGRSSAGMLPAPKSSNGSDANSADGSSYSSDGTKK